jgi:FkbM family methyltransferase
MAFLRLLGGEFPAAWTDYAPPAAAPSWDGGDIAGKRLLLHVDLAGEDLLQFLRYVPLLAGRGADVTLLCAAALRAPLAALLPDVAVAAAATPADVEARLSQLPPLLGRAGTVPYLSAPASSPLPAPLGTRLKVGIAWVGNRDRPLRLEDLLPLAAVPGVALYSLQAGREAAEAKKSAHPALLRDLAVKSLDDAAAAIAGLDLVITADGPLAHLAGALAKPVWNLLPFAPDWRWGTSGDQSEWYPSMRLFRQKRRGEWSEVTDDVVARLGELAAAQPIPAGELAEIRVCSVFPKEIHHGDTESTEEKRENDDSCPYPSCLHGEPLPRFVMAAPRSHLADPGIRFLVNKEYSGIGYEYATRSFLDAHLLPGDLFIDVGAHWGIMSLQAATRWPGQVQALAFEPLPHNLPHLRRWIDDNKVGDAVEVIAAAASDRGGQGRLKPESTMGHSLIKDEHGPISVVTIDSVLARRPQLDGRRVLVKIDVEGSEIDVVLGMQSLLRSGRVAALIWERGIEYDRPSGRKRQSRLRRLLAKHGFTAWHFANEDEAGRLLPFTDDRKSSWHGNVFELAAGLAPLPAYGLPRPPAPVQPNDAALMAALHARHAFQLGFAAQKQGKAAEAGNLYAKAAGLDGSVPGLYNNLGVLLRDGGRCEAAVACYRRALAQAPLDTSVMSNLGNALRDLGRLEEAAALQQRALALQPENPSLLYNAGVMHKDRGRPELALPLFDRALALAPDDPDYRWDRALVLLQMGSYAEGFAAYEARWGLARAKKRSIALPRWDGTPLQGRSITLTDEQGFGDALQFARFIPEVKRRGAGRIILECQPEMMRLMALTPGVDQVVPREKAIFDSDLYLPLLSLPGLFGTTLATLPREVPYLRAPEPQQCLADDGRRKLGLVWAGKPTPRDRSCPLELLLPLLGDPRLAPYSLQVGPRAADLKASGADAFVTDLAPMLVDFAETAAMLRQLDLLVTVDTSVAHLAGALGVRTFLLLRHTSDWRWFDRGSDSPWYPGMTLFRQRTPDRWDGPLQEMRAALTRELAIHAQNGETHSPVTSVSGD